MVKSLADDGLVVYEPRVGVRLTPKGKNLALGVLRRHRIAEAFLVQVLGMDWSEVHEDAERLEHAISDKVLDRMDALLNRPTRDPHGDPIPAIDGGLARESHRNLMTAKVGDRVKVSRILDQSSDFLSYVRRLGMAPGAMIVVADRDSQADSVHVSLPGGEEVALSMRVAAKIAVE
jgi:DtxR family Mn-dependent transcriptional regulator